MKPPKIDGGPDKKTVTATPTSLTTSSGINNANATDKDKAIPYYENPNYLIQNKIGRTGYWNEFQKYLQNYTLPTGEKFIQNEQANKGTTNEFSDKALQDYRTYLTKKFGEGHPNVEKMAITPADVKQVQTYYNQGNPNLKIDSRIGGETSQLRYPTLTKADVKVPEGTYAPVLYGKKQYLAPADKYNSGDIANNLIEYNPSYDTQIDPNALKAIGNYTTQSTMPIQSKAKGGKIVRGYRNGDVVRPDTDPMKQQGVIQIGSPQYTSTGNATNNQGQQSSQVDPSDPYGKNKVNSADLFSKNNISGAIVAGTTLAASLSANKQLKGEQKRKADVGAINSTVDTVASMVPVYGQVYAGAKAASGIAKSALPTDANGDVQGKENEQLNRIFTPLHETVINDISKGNTTDALLDTLSLGVYGMHKDYFSYDDRQKQKEVDKQTKLNEFRKINTQSKIEQAMANRDSGDFGKKSTDVYDINSAKFDNAGNFQSINPTGYKGGGLVGKIKQMCAEGGSIKPTITNDKVMEVAMSGKGYDALNKYDKQRVDAMKQHMNDKGNKDMITFPKMIQGKADGGEIRGKGTTKSDSIHAKVEEGSFIVPAENAELAKGIRKLYLKVPNKKANVNQKEGEEVLLSNKEHLFTPEENEDLESMGINLEALAPNAEKEEDGKAKGGPILSEKEAKQALNNTKTQQFLLRQKLNKQISDYEANPNRDPNQLPIINSLKSKVKTINDTYGYKNEYTPSAVNNVPANKNASAPTTGTSLRAPKSKQEVATPLEMKKSPSLTEGSGIPNADIPVGNLKMGDVSNMPSPQQKAQYYGNKKSGILGALSNIDPTMAVGPMQTAMGINMLQGSTRPVDKAVLDATYNANVNRAQDQGKYGYTPEQLAMLNQENQASLNDARFSARNFAGGNAGTAFNQERQAINQGWANKLGLTSADQQLRMQKQQYADEQVANRANTLSANRRQAYMDALGAFQQKQAAGSELIGAGLQNVIGAYRYNKELNNEEAQNNQRNAWSSKLGS